MGSVFRFSIFLVVLLKYFSVGDSQWVQKELWEDRPGEFTFRAFIFNVTNSDEFLEGKGQIKPIVEEVGPFTYKLVKKKVDPSRLYEDGSIKYKEQNNYFFDVQNPVSKHTKFHTLNSQLLVLASRVSKSTQPFPGNFIGNVVKFDNEQVLTTATAEELLFTGVNSSLYIKKEEHIDSPEGGKLIPGFELFKDGTYAYPKNRGGSISAEFRIHGETTSPRPGDIISYNGETKIDYWASSDCNDISKSTDGSIISSSLTVFLPELCRTIVLKPDGKVDYDGIEADKYILPQDIFSYREEKDKCYCIEGNCLENGVLDIQSCSLGLPYVVSLPNFFGANTKYREVFDEFPGASNELHQTFYIVEPVTGTILESAKRFQMNMRINYPEIGYGYDYQSFNMDAFPILWTEEIYKLDTKSVKDLKIYLSSVTTQKTTTSKPTMETATPTNTTTPVPPTVKSGEYLEHFNKIEMQIASLNSYIWLLTVFLLALLFILILIGIYITVFNTKFNYDKKQIHTKGIF